MISDLPTPEELGEKLKAGEITKEEAIEVMSERARREAFSSMFAGAESAENAKQGGGTAPAGLGAAGKWILFGIVLLLTLIFLLLQMLG